MSRPGVLFVLNYLGQASVTRRTLALIDGLRERYDFHVACIKVAGGPGSEIFETLGIKMAILPAGRLPNFCAVPRLARYIRAHRIQIVHTQVLASDVIGGIAARLAGQTLLFSTKSNMHYISGQGLSLLRNLPYWLSMYLPDQVIAVSEVMRSEILEHVHLSPERVVTIRTGIDVGSFGRAQARAASREELGLEHGDLALVYAGRLAGGKGLEYLIEAVRQAVADEPGLRLVLMGEGPLAGRLQELVLEAGLSRQTIFTGFRLDVPNLLAAADVFVLPSLTEGLPQSMMEAMAAGRAVIAASVGGVPEIVEHGVTGLLVPPRDSQALAEAILQLVKHPALRESLGANARAAALERFGVGHMIECYNALYQTHLERKKK